MIKKMVKNIFKLFGFSVEKIKTATRFPANTVRQTMCKSLEHITKLGFSPNLVIDVGAANGTLPLLKIFPKTKHIWIEPLEEFESDLKKLSLEYDGVYFIAGAGKVSGKATINVHSDLHGSSLYNETDGKLADGLPRDIDLIRLDDLIDKYSISKNVLLKIDVQGAELDVLDGAKKLLDFCEIIILEVSFFKFLKNAPDFYDVVSYMKQHGFVAYDIFDGHNRLLDGALAQRDILFVKESGFFRKSHRWANDIQIKDFNAKSLTYREQQL